MFDQSKVLAVAAPVYGGAQVFISWTPTTAGLLWQVYLNASLAYEGNQTSAWLAVPTAGVNRVDVGAISASEAGTNFAGSLPPTPSRRAKISWSGGLSLGANLVGFRVYMGGSAGAAVSYTTPVADVGAFPGGTTVATGSYSWTSDTLASGVWHFGIRPYDASGNEGTTTETTVTITAPPGPPARFTADGARLHYTLIPGGTTPSVGLAWNAVEHA